MPRKLGCVIAFLAVIALAGVSGCGKSGPKVFKISGKVLLDGEPLKVPTGGNARIVFQPADTTAELAQGEFRKAANGRIEEDGTFQMFTVKPGDGVIPGKYKVAFVVEGKYGDASTSLIPAKYNDPQKSGEEITVDKSKSDVVFDLKKS